MVGLGDLPGGAVLSEANAVSSDGLTVVGESNSASGMEAFRWTARGGMVGLGDLPGGQFRSAAQGISADGLTIVGTAGSASGSEAFRWTASRGMVGLSDLLGGAFFSEAHDVSAHGLIVVGHSISASGDEAFIWDSLNGMRSLQVVLTDDLGLNLSGWTLSTALGVSDDGLTIVGRGINPAGFSEAWIAIVPAPGSVTMLALVGLLAVRRRSVQRRRSTGNNRRTQYGLLRGGLPLYNCNATQTM